MQKASKTLLVLAGLSLAAIGTLSHAVTVLSIRDGDTISAGSLP